MEREKEPKRANAGRSVGRPATEEDLRVIAPSFIPQVDAVPPSW